MSNGLTKALSRGYPTEDCGAKQAVCDLREPTIKEDLLRKKGRYEAMLLDINEAISALESNPAVETVLNLIAKTGRY